jgi:hypothetical protein
MALTPFQLAVQQLARSMGLKGEAEKQVYNTPEYQRLVSQFYPGPAVDIGAGQQQAEQNTMMTALQNLQNLLSGGGLNLNNFQQQLADINSKLTSPVQLAGLSDADLARLNEIKANSDAQLADQQNTLGGKLVADLYGRGLNQSSIANQSAADFAKVMGMLQLQSNSDAASRELALRQFLTQTGQGNLALAGQNTLGAGNMAIAGFTSTADALNQIINMLNQTNLQRAGLNETQRQSSQSLFENQRQFNAQLDAQKGSFWKNLAGAAASIGLSLAIPGVGGLIKGKTAPYVPVGPGE